MDRMKPYVVLFSASLNSKFSLFFKEGDTKRKFKKVPGFILSILSTWVLDLLAISVETHSNIGSQPTAPTHLQLR